jgi:transcriptional regulator with XRE-family HTH domain
MLMKTPYHERDYTFGQRILTLRTAIGLTQAGLANRLRVSRRAVGEWEAGSSYPKLEHLKEMIVLGVENQAWACGSKAQELEVEGATVDARQARLQVQELDDLINSMDVMQQAIDDGTRKPAFRVSTQFGAKSSSA